LKEIKRRVASSDPWPQLLLFPEGTCTNREALITFKPGAFHPGLPVQPVLFRYPGSDGENDCVSWSWKGAGWAKVLWRTLARLNTNCEIEYLPVYRPSEEEKRDPVLYARNVRAVMAKYVKNPVFVEHDIPCLMSKYQCCSRADE
jgi:lysophosphatidylcholine acyltransferase/lyso-PAF acetyltransferase